MLALGHTGITLSVAILFSGAFIKSGLSHEKKNKNEDYDILLAENEKGKQNIFETFTSWLTNLSRVIDVRILLVGALLPDIIDKPLGILFFNEEISNGRIYSHTLLFLILITIAGVYLYRNKRKTWLLILSLGTFTHFILDQMWRNSQTLFWPLLGVEFQKTDVTEWIPHILLSLRTNPAVYVPEIIGFVVLVWFVIVLIKQKNIITFLRKGQIR